MKGKDASRGKLKTEAWKQALIGLNADHLGTCQAGADDNKAWQLRSFRWMRTAVFKRGA